jgi:hypothetical protein
VCDGLLASGAQCRTVAGAAEKQGQNFVCSRGGKRCNAGSCRLLCLHSQLEVPAAQPFAAATA